MNTSDPYFADFCRVGAVGISGFEPLFMRLEFIFADKVHMTELRQRGHNGIIK